MKRIFIDSQSNPRFVGEESEQAYDQRAGLCQAGKDDVVVTTEPFDSSYLSYWRGLGFPIPHLVVAGPYEEDKTLSTLVAKKPEIQNEIKSFVNGGGARIEFFTIFDGEKDLVDILGIPAYCDFDFSLEFQSKLRFKEVATELGISTLPYISIKEVSSYSDLVEKLPSSTEEYMAKEKHGIGGADLGSVYRISDQETFREAASNPNICLIEPSIPLSSELSVHWEITEERDVRIIGIFNQLAENDSYSGVTFPYEDNEVISLLESELSILSEKLRDEGGLGYMCCDVLVDVNKNIYWSDLNTRKGAVLFIKETIDRMPFLQDKKPYVFHGHLSSCLQISSFEQIEAVTGHMLKPSSDGFIVITNPGGIKYGTIDITAISFESIEDSKEIFERAVNRFKAV